MEGELYFNSRATLVCFAFARPRPMGTPSYVTVRPGESAAPFECVFFLSPQYRAIYPAADTSGAGAATRAGATRPWEHRGVLSPSSAQGPLPAVAHLRMYEPLSQVVEPRRSELIRAVSRPRLGVADALRAEQAASVRAGRSGSLPTGDTTVLTLEPADVPGGTHRVVGPGMLVCPWDTGRRSAAAVVGASQRLPALLRRAAGLDEALVQRARRSLANDSQGPVHVLSSTWSVPLAWFALVDPAGRQVLVDGSLRRPVWRAPVADVRVRAERVLRTCSEHLGEVSQVAALADLLRWLSRFPEGCAVELDYAGLGGLLDDAALAEDVGCNAVHRMVGQLERGEGHLVAATMAPVTEFWARVRSWEHAS